jgi:hypothetical protein
MSGLTQRSRVLLEEVIFAQLFKKIPEFYGTRKFIAVLFTILSQMNPFNTLPSRFF